MKTEATMICNIPCYLRDPKLCELVKMTLEKIRDRHPKDILRLQKLVRTIQPYVDTDRKGLGIWLEDLPDPNDQTTWHFGCGDTPGVLKIVETMPINIFPGVLAHELGHAATRFEDLERRGSVCSQEWRSELVADWYAYKWGFGRDIAKSRKTRDWMHHGPPPGSSWEEEVDGKIYHYRITRNFVGHLTKVVEGKMDRALF